MPFFKKERLLSGFSLIELMVVVSLFGIAASLITASYLTFERNQRLKNAASQIKSDIRLVQNKASAGDKGPIVADSVCPRVSYILGGWYFLASANQLSYTIGGDCVRQSDGNETLFYDGVTTQKVISLPKDIRINRIFTDTGNVGLPMAIFYRPLKSGVSFHNAGATFPGFFLADGTNLDNLMPGMPQNTTVTIELANNVGTLYQVKIQSTGEINEFKP